MYGHQTFRPVLAGHHRLGDALRLRLADKLHAFALIGFLWKEEDNM